MKINPKDYRPNVGMMIINQNKEIFVGKRIDHPSEFWQMPQGGIDPKEKSEVAALREMEEEVGGIGELIAWNKTYYPNGWVGFVVVNDEEFPFNQASWTVRDSHVSIVQWFTTLPEFTHWDVQEVVDLSTWIYSIESGH